MSQPFKVWKTNKAGALVMTFPKQIANALGIRKGSEVKAVQKGKTMVVTKK